MNLPGVRLGIKKYAFYTHTHVTDKVNNEFRKKLTKMCGGQIYIIIY